MVMHRVKMLPIYMRIRTKFRKRIYMYGKKYEDRTRKHVRSSTIAIMAGCVRPLLRERAKQ